MIILTTPNTSPMSGSGIACKTLSQAVRTSVKLAEAVQFCICDYVCEYEEKAFFDFTAGEENKDITPILANVLDPLGTIEFFLVDGDNEIALNDNTYGEFFPLGFNTDNPTKSGYRLDWNLVFTNNGAGLYRIKTVVTNFSAPEEILSYKYRLIQYTEENAHGTVLITTIHNGFVVGGLDYTGLNWENRIRVEGELKDYQPITENTNFLNTDRSIRQIQQSVISEYDLLVRSVPQEVFLPLFNDRLLANTILINDYNLFNPLQKVRDLSVYWDSNNSFEGFFMNNKKTARIKVIETDQSTVKRNVNF